MNSNKFIFQSLESLRGWAAIAVAIFHFSPTWAGYLAVDFFLVLSGFILSHSYLYKEKATPVVEFISHRLARLYPLHIFTLITFVLVFTLTRNHFPSYSDGTLFTLFQQLTLTHNIGLNPSGLTWNFPSWSISVEFWVNIIFILFITKNTKSSTLFLLALTGLFIIYSNTGHLDTHATNYYNFLNSGLVRGMASFFIGILSYRVFLHFKNNVRMKKYANYIEFLAVFSIIVIVFSRSGKLSSLDILAPFVFMFAISIFAYEDGFLSKQLKKTRYLGEISYSIYLNQVTLLLLINLIQRWYRLPELESLIIYLLTLTIYSHFTYIYIEKPLRKRGRNILCKITSSLSNIKHH